MGVACYAFMAGHHSKTAFGCAGPCSYGKECIYDHSVPIPPEKDFVMNQFIPRMIVKVLQQKGVNIEKARQDYAKLHGAPSAPGPKAPDAKAKAKAKKEQEQKEKADKEQAQAAAGAIITGNAKKRRESSARRAKKSVNRLDNNDLADFVCHAHLRGLCTLHKDGMKSCKHGTHMTPEEYDAARKTFKSQQRADLEALGSAQ